MSHHFFTWGLLAHACACLHVCAGEVSVGHLPSSTPRHTHMLLPEEKPLTLNLEFTNLARSSKGFHISASQLWDRRHAPS